MREVLDLEQVALVADDVGAERQQPAVRADRDGAEREEVVALGELVGVEQHLFAGYVDVSRRAWAASSRPRPSRGTGSSRRTACPRGCARSTTSHRSVTAPTDRSPSCARGSPRRSACAACRGGTCGRWSSRSPPRGRRGSRGTRRRAATRSCRPRCRRDGSALSGPGGPRAGQWERRWECSSTGRSEVLRRACREPTGSRDGTTPAAWFLHRDAGVLWSTGRFLWTGGRLLWTTRRPREIARIPLL